MISFLPFKSNEEILEAKPSLGQKVASLIDVPKTLTFRKLQPTHLDLTAVTVSTKNSRNSLVLAPVPPAPTTATFPKSQQSLFEVTESDDVPKDHSRCPGCAMLIPLPLKWDFALLLEDPMAEMNRAWWKMLVDVAVDWHAEGTKNRMVDFNLLRELNAHLEEEMQKLEEYLQELEAEEVGDPSPFYLTRGSSSHVSFNKVTRARKLHLRYLLASLKATPLTKLKISQSLYPTSHNQTNPDTMSDPSTLSTTPENNSTSTNQDCLIQPLHHISSLNTKELHALKQDHALEIERIHSRSDAQIADLEAEHQRITRVFETQIQRREQENFDLIAQAEEDGKQHQKEVDELRQKNLELKAESERLFKDVQRHAATAHRNAETSVRRNDETKQLRDDAAANKVVLGQSRAECDSLRSWHRKRDALIDKYRVEMLGREREITAMEKAAEKMDLDVRECLNRRDDAILLLREDAATNKQELKKCREECDSLSSRHRERDALIDQYRKEINEREKEIATLKAITHKVTSDFGKSLLRGDKIKQLCADPATDKEELEHFRKETVFQRQQQTSHDPRNGMSLETLERAADLMIKIFQKVEKFEPMRT
ncbi:MAG: hypothetical protein Q9160_007621 [Pyrenula sp. 1 TL-2023]